MRWIQKWLDECKKIQLGRQQLPEVGEGNPIRVHVRFEGHVQNVGFRMEVYYIARHYHLAGWVRNLSDTSVEAELQGNEAAIDYLIGYMQRLPRAEVTKVRVDYLDWMEEDTDFLVM